MGHPSLRNLLGGRAGDRGQRALKLEVKGERFASLPGTPRRAQTLRRQIKVRARGSPAGLACRGILETCGFGAGFLCQQPQPHGAVMQLRGGEQ
jgi:hypothetical protein